MAIEKKLFDTCSCGAEIYAYTLSNNSGTSVRVLNYGGILANIWVKDKNGEVCPNSDRVISFTTRPGTRLVSLCNGDAASRENFKGSSMRTFHGFLVAAVEGAPEGLEFTAADMRLK